jgi:hypothetical protein
MQRKPVVNSHASEETLEQYATRRLSEEQLAPFEEHLLVCEACMDACAETDRYVEAMRSAAKQIRRNEKPRGGWLRRIFVLEPRPLWAMGFAGAVLVLLAGIEWQARYPRNAAPLAIALTAARGWEAAGMQATPGRPLILNVDLTELASYPDYRLEVVTATGERVGEWNARPEAGKLSVRVDSLRAAGTYFVRLYSPQRELLREYALRVARG